KMICESCMTMLTFGSMATSLCSSRSVASASNSPLKLGYPLSLQEYSQQELTVRYAGRLSDAKNVSRKQRAAITWPYDASLIPGVKSQPILSELPCTHLPSDPSIFARNWRTGGKTTRHAAHPEGSRPLRRGSRCVE